MADPQVLRGVAVATLLGAVLVYVRETFAIPGSTPAPGPSSGPLPSAGLPTVEGQRILARLASFEPEVLAAAASFNLDPDLLRALVMRESRGNPQALGDLDHPKGPAYGLGQLLVSTARGMGFTGDPTDLLDPGLNLYYTARYLREQLDAWGDTRLAIAAYNSGSPRFIGGDQLINEPYVQDILTNLAALHG